MPTDNSDNKNSENNLIYNISDLKELIALKFREYKELDTNISFSIIVEIENEMVDQEILSLESDQDIKNKKFCTLAKTLLVPIQEGYRYYWKIQNLYLNIQDS
ncbi:32871_t:CDS:1 [Racocetra persica]|uniref:32871_t:CDS:1 n=1 Tax=Racocetra persica TaxID=160502 RepID=A0ACA9KEU0_9GLOM|nr:32871_t:CDS:1 [Racocetra persica]